MELGSPSSYRLFVAAGRIDEIYERGVVLSIDSSQRDSIPEADV